MSKDLNLCQFIGRLGQAPEVRYLPNGGAVANFSIAVGDDYKDKNGQKVEQTEWVRVTVYRKLAEVCGQYLDKGSRVYLSGKMKTRKWQDQSGQDKYTTEIVASEMQMLDSRETGSQDSEKPQSSPPAQDAPNQGFADFDDDIPFMRLGAESFV